MSTSTVRVSEEAKETLRRLSAQTGRKPGELIGEAVERYHRELFLKDADAAFGALRADEGAWAEEEGERAAWEGTLPNRLEK